MNTQTSPRPHEAIAQARQLLRTTPRGGDWRELVYAEIVQLNRFIREGEERLVLESTEAQRQETHALVNQLISARVDLERALLGPSVDDWNPTVLTGKAASPAAKPAKAASNGLLIALVIGIGTIIAVLACAIAGALGLFGVVSITGLPTIVETSNGIEIPSLMQGQNTPIPVATFAAPPVLGAASISKPDPDAPPPAEDASRELVGLMPSPVPVIIVPTAVQPTAVPATATPEPPPSTPTEAPPLAINPPVPVETPVPAGTPVSTDTPAPTP